VPSAPVRDAIIEAETDLFLAYQAGAAYAAAQSDPTRATGMYLDGFLNEVELFRQPNETDEPARTRYFSGGFADGVVTPLAILATVNAILAPYTTHLSELSDSVLDRWYVQQTDSADADLTWDPASSSYVPAVWHSFVGDGITDMDPDYPDRRYTLRQQPYPGGARTWNDEFGREFLLRVPDISASDAYAAYVADGTSTVVARYVYDGAQTNGDAAFVFQGLSDSDAVYAAIVSQVEAIRGQGIRWLMIVDPRL